MLRSLLGMGLCLALVTACSLPVATNLAEDEANSAVLALERAGIHGTKELDPGSEGRWLLSVARQDASAAVAVLASEDLPGARSPGVLEALGGEQLVPSRTLEHAQWMAGTAGELERTLRSVPGVLSARVHLASPEKDAFGLGENPPGARASVLLRHRGSTTPIAPADVQRLVAGAVVGLAPEAVNVIATPAPPRSAATQERLSQLGPITVTRSSTLPLKLVFGGALLLNLILLSLVGVFWSRDRHARARLAELDEAKEAS